ncbi:MAG: HutD family protein [Alsobacter sp.]
MALLRFADCRTMRWKNGGGATTEIAVFPEEAGLDAFDWRISMARVEADGPFSAFPGIDRTLAIVDGDGLALSVGGREPCLVTQLGSPLPFPADEPASARLLGGAILDLNVMSRRGAWRHRLAVLEMVDGAVVRSAAPVAFLVARDGPLAFRLGGRTLALGARDALRIDADSAWTATVVGAGAIFLVELSPA